MRYLAVVALLCACVALFACSSGPRPPQAGTPAFYWSEANTNYRAGDYVTANDKLERILRHENEYAARAQPWALVLSSGIVQGLTKASDAWVAGGKAHPTHPIGFNRHTSEARTLANATALRNVDIFRSFVEKYKDPQVTLAFEYPPASPPQPPELDKIAKGTLLSEAESEAFHRAMVQRGVVYALARVAGAPDEPGKVQEMFKSQAVQVPRDVFLFGMAQLLFEQAQLYDRKHIADPRRAGLLFGEAVAAVSAMSTDKQGEKKAKDLLQKIQRAQKELPGAVT